MIEIGSQPIGRNYVAHPLSRSFLLSYLCYILVLLVPALLLVNIDYSWPTYQRQIIVPALRYQSYQLACLDDTGALVYNSNLQNGAETKFLGSGVSVGVEGQRVRVQGQVLESNLRSCSVQVYFLVGLGQSVNAMVHLPLAFEVSSSVNGLVSAVTRGTLSVKSSVPISQSSVLTINETQLGPFPYSFMKNFQSSGAKSIKMDSELVYTNIKEAAVSGSFAFNSEYQVNNEIYMKQTELIDKLRSFIPIYMYICLFLWWVVVDPLINWMLRNKVYVAKAIPDKFKRE